MNSITFTVTIRRPGKLPVTLLAVGSDSAGLAIAMQDRYGPCGVTVKARTRRAQGAARC